MTAKKRIDDLPFNSELCQERHDVVNNSLKIHGLKLDKHGERLDKLEQHKSKVEVQIKNLIEKIDDLINTIKWLMLGLLASAGSFIIWYIQQL